MSQENRGLETLEANPAREIDPDFARKPDERDDAPENWFRSLGLEALTAFPIAHDRLEEREEAVGVFAGLHGADLVLKGAKGVLVNDEIGRENTG